MSKMLVISQEETDTWFVDGISIGQRHPRIIVGTKIKELLKDKGIGEDTFVKDMGTNYSDSIKRVLEDKEIPKEKLFNKIAEYFKVDKDYFYDKNLKNVIINDRQMVIGEFETEARAMEVKKELDTFIEECYRNNKPIIIRIPKV